MKLVELEVGRNWNYYWKEFWGLIHAEYFGVMGGGKWDFSDSPDINVSR